MLLGHLRLVEVRLLDARSLMTLKQDMVTSAPGKAPTGWRGPEYVLLLRRCCSAARPTGFGKRLLGPASFIIGCRGG